MRVLPLLLILGILGCCAPAPKAPRNPGIPTIGIEFPKIDPTLTEVPADVCKFDKTLPIKVAVIDTGLDLKDPRFAGHICPNASKDFTGDDVRDVLGHGTHVAGLIRMYAGEGNYCFVILKYYSLFSTGDRNDSRYLNAVKESAKQKVNLINISAGGPGPTLEEYIALKKNSKSIIVTATGNDGKDLDEPGNGFYPASYNIKNLIAVGSFTPNGIKSSWSNWNKKMVIENGNDVLSYAPNNAFRFASGTSMSTAIRTGKILHYMLNSCKKLEKK